MITVDGRPICGSCGTEYPVTRTLHPTDADVRTDTFGLRQLNPHEYQQRARAAGWRIHHGTTAGGAHIDDALCPRCGKPDPETVRLCRELERSIREGA